MDTGNRIVAFYVTRRAAALARKLAQIYPDIETLKFSREAVAQAWRRSESIIFITASGIAVRTIAPLLRNKQSDPAVVVIDEGGRYAVSLLSGHLGGANERAREIASFLGGAAVITTASDVSSLTSIDIFAGNRDLIIEDWKALPRVAARFVDTGTLFVYSDAGIDLPPGYVATADPASADLVVTNRTDAAPPESLVLRPRNLVVGLGCNSGISSEEIEGAVKTVFSAHNLSFSSLACLATITMKAGEAGIATFAKTHHLPITVYSAEELNGVKCAFSSAAVFKATGARAVAEPAAILEADSDTLLVKKQKIGNVTVAVAEMHGTLSRVPRKGRRDAAGTRGRIYVVGIGPGTPRDRTRRAEEAISGSSVIVGYNYYLKLIADLTEGKEIVSSGMREERERCRAALDRARAGEIVSLVSSGDPGIYGMAGLILEMASHEGCDVPIEIIPGVSAANAAAAKFGAPLMLDFAVISLSDLLVPWGTIMARLEAVAAADIVAALYNPRSRKRVKQIEEAAAVFKRHRPGKTPVGIATALGTGEEHIILSDLDHFLEHEITMRSIVVIGNRSSKTVNGRFITPRGYQL